MPNHKLGGALNYPRAHCLLHPRKRPRIFPTLSHGYNRWRSPGMSSRDPRGVQPPLVIQQPPPFFCLLHRETHCPQSREKNTPIYLYIHLPFFILHQVSTGTLDVVVWCLKYQCHICEACHGVRVDPSGRELLVECCRSVRLS